MPKILWRELLYLKFGNKKSDDWEGCIKNDPKMCDVMYEWTLKRSYFYCILMFYVLQKCVLIKFTRFFQVSGERKKRFNLILCPISAASAEKDKKKNSAFFCSTPRWSWKPSVQFRTILLLSLKGQEDRQIRISNIILTKWSTKK